MQGVFERPAGPGRAKARAAVCGTAEDRKAAKKFVEGLKDAKSQAGK